MKLLAKASMYERKCSVLTVPDPMVMSMIQEQRRMMNQQLKHAIIMPDSPGKVFCSQTPPCDLPPPEGRALVPTE